MQVTFLTIAFGNYLFKQFQVFLLSLQVFWFCHWSGLHWESSGTWWQLPTYFIWVLIIFGPISIPKRPYLVPVSLATRIDDDGLDCKSIWRMRQRSAQECLLYEFRLTLNKTDEICRAAESLDMQMTTIKGGQALWSAQNTPKDKEVPQRKQTVPQSKSDIPECWHCGRIHDTHKREISPAFGKLS